MSQRFFPNWVEKASDNRGNCAIWSQSTDAAGEDLHNETGFSPDTDAERPSAASEIFCAVSEWQRSGLRRWSWFRPCASTEERVPRHMGRVETFRWSIQDPENNGSGALLNVVGSQLRIHHHRTDLFIAWSKLYLKIISLSVCPRSRVYNHFSSENYGKVEWSTAIILRCLVVVILE